MWDRDRFITIRNDGGSETIKHWLFVKVDGPNRSTSRSSMPVEYDWCTTVWVTCFTQYQNEERVLIHGFRVVGLDASLTFEDSATWAVHLIRLSVEQQF